MGWGRCPSAQESPGARLAGPILGRAGRIVDGPGKFQVPVPVDRSGALHHSRRRAAPARADRSRAVFRADARHRSVVGVAGIGNDPMWPERDDNTFNEYWGRAAFGELTETGKSRHAVLADILPGLAIAAQCRLEDRYLLVEGRLRSYRIHLGSGNIQMDPNNQYLCIVADRPNAGARVRL